MVTTVAAGIVGISLGLVRFRRFSWRAALLFAGLALLLSFALAQEITFWSTEVQPERLAKQEQIVADFEAATGIKVNLVPVEESEAKKVLRLIDALDDLDDVQDVYSNYDIEDSVMEKVLAEA